MSMLSAHLSRKRHWEGDERDQPNVFYRIRDRQGTNAVTEQNFLVFSAARVADLHAITKKKTTHDKALLTKGVEHNS